MKTSLDRNIFLVNTLFGHLIQMVFRLRRKCDSDQRLDGKVVIITGASNGIGKETALQMSKRGARVIIGCRDSKKADIAIDEIKYKNPKAQIRLVHLDTSSMTSVRQFAAKVSKVEPSIDILINNAGVFRCPESITKDGFERQFATNYLGHFLLTMLLMPSLKKSPRARVVNVASKCYEVGDIDLADLHFKNKPYDSFLAYIQSKFAIVLITKEMSDRLEMDSTVTCYSLHPGVTDTSLLQQLPIFKSFIFRFIRRLLMSTELGCQTTLYCALEKMLDIESGNYYENCQRIGGVPSNEHDDTAKSLWEISCDSLGLDRKII